MDYGYGATFWECVDGGDCSVGAAHVVWGRGGGRVGRKEGKREGGTEGGAGGSCAVVLQEGKVDGWSHWKGYSRMPAQKGR